MSANLPTLRQLQFLAALAEHGSFSRAAEACFVTQPTLSAAIKELELTLGAQLVERGPRGASLTAAGEAAATRARGMLADAEELVQSTRAAGEPMHGVFRLGVIPTIAPYILPRLAPALRARFPALKLYLREDLTGRLYEDLRDRRIDAALIALPYEAAGVETQAVAADEFLFAVARNHPLAKRKAVSVAEVAGERLLLLDDGHCLRDHAISICSTESARSDFAATSLHTLVEMVRNGLGATLLPRLAVDAGLTQEEDLAIIPFDPPIVGREIGVAWRKGSARTAEARLVAAVVKSVIGAAP